MRALLVTALTAAIAAACAGHAPAATPLAVVPAAAPTMPGPRPTLVVFITVDQLRPDYFLRYQSQLTGGLGRLLRNGAFFENGFQDHAITETAPGHSVTLSGRFPRSTGIVANTAGVLDPQTPMIGGGGSGASPFRFRGSVLIDWMRYADPRSRALSVSRKDRGAILPMGRAHQEVFWYASDGRFTTSTYYADTLPSWVQQFNARQLPQGYAGKSWDLLLPASQYPEPDSVDYEAMGHNFVFPHPVPTDPAAAAQSFAGFPFMDEVTLQMALAGVQALHLGDGPQSDLLAVSLSTTDAIGHAYGPDSREIHDQVLRLDRYLGAFMDSLFKLRDSTHIVFALTADHGVGPFPQAHAAATGQPARWVDVFPALDSVRAGLRARHVDTSLVAFDDAILLVDRPRLQAAGLSADSITSAFATIARRIPGVQRVDAVASLAARDTTRDYVARRWLHMLPLGVPAAAVVTLEPYAYWAGVRYATHGTPHDYDARVPIVFYGAGIRPGRHNETARVVDVAPTLAWLLGIVPTEILDGHPLTAIAR